MSTHKIGVLDESKPDKQLFSKYVTAAGFPSMRQFALSIGVSPMNLSDRLSGRYVVSVPMLYVFAKGLGRTIDEMVEVFFPKLWRDNQYECQNRNDEVK